jgi:hypothetical protein
MTYGIKKSKPKAEKGYELKPISKVKSKNEARQIAMDYQNWSSEHSMSWGEVATYNQYFTSLARKFNLVKEFKENAII